MKGWMTCDGRRGGFERNVEKQETGEHEKREEGIGLKEDRTDEVREDN